MGRAVEWLFESDAADAPFIFSRFSADRRVGLVRERAVTALLSRADSWRRRWRPADLFPGHSDSGLF